MLPNGSSTPNTTELLQEDSHPKAHLKQVAEKISRPDFLAGQGLGNEIGFWVFDYPLDYEQQLREHLSFLPELMTRQNP